MLDSSDDANIINKINKLIKDEVNIYSSIPKTLSKKSKITHKATHTHTYTKNKTKQSSKKHT